MACAVHSHCRKFCQLEAVILQIKHELLRAYCSFVSVRKEKKNVVFKILFEVDRPESIDIQSSRFKIKVTENVAVWCDRMENRIKGVTRRD